MATIGGKVYADAVHEFFEGIRTYDAKRAAAVLATNADLQWPFSSHILRGKDAIEAHLTEVLADAKGRPSFTIRDIEGDGSVVRLMVNVSKRFGESPKHFTIHMLHAKDLLHHVMFEAE